MGELRQSRKSYSYVIKLIKQGYVFIWKKVLIICSEKLRQESFYLEEFLW